MTDSNGIYDALVTSPAGSVTVFGNPNPVYVVSGDRLIGSCTIDHAERSNGILSAPPES